MSAPLVSTLRRSGGRPVVRLWLIAAVLAVAASEVWAGPEDDHERRDRGNRAHHGPSVRRPVYRPRYEYPYAQPIYVPPPIYEQPRQSPGISLFLPFDLRR